MAFENELKPICAEQGRMNGVFVETVRPIPINDVLPRCRSLGMADIKAIVALEREKWEVSAGYVAESAFYQKHPVHALNMLLPRMPMTLMEMVWRGSWLSQAEVASLNYEVLVAAATQVVEVTRREKPLRELALAAAEELQLSDELIGKLLGER